MLFNLCTFICLIEKVERDGAAVVIYNESSRIRIREGKDGLEREDESRVKRGREREYCVMNLGGASYFQVVVVVVWRNMENE